MAQICVLVNSQEFVRNYLKTNAFKSTCSEHNVSLFLWGNLTIDEIDNKIFQEIQILDKPNSDFLGRLLFDLYMIKHRKLSTSFQYRIKRKFPNVYWQFQYLRSHKVITGQSNSNQDASVQHNKKKTKFKVVKNWTRFAKLGILFIRGKFIKVLYFLAVKPPLFFIVTKTLIIIQKRSYHGLQSFDNFDLLLIPTSAYEPIVPILTKRAKHKGVKTMLLVDNWDNLSSKSILWDKPDSVVCWGPQTLSHATQIQGMDSSNCFPIGTPRIDKYFKDRVKKLPSLFTFPYILFLGSTLPYSEVDFLLKLDREVSQNTDRYGELKVVYRPHPLRGGWQQVSEGQLKSTIIDPDVRDRYVSGDLRWNKNGIFPPLDNYPALLKNACHVVSGLTSMIFEASIFYKNCTVLTFDEPKNLTNPKRIFEEYIHFNGIDTLPNLTLCDSHESALTNIFDSITTNVTVSPSEIDKALREFLHFDESTYEVRLSKLINDILKV